MITWDLLQGQWFLKDIKPSDKGSYLNIISTECIENWQIKTVYKRVKIR